MLQSTRNATGGARGRDQRYRGHHQSERRLHQVEPPQGSGYWHKSLSCAIFK